MLQVTRIVFQVIVNDRAKSFASKKMRLFYGNPLILYSLCHAAMSYFKGNLLFYEKKTNTRE